MQQGLGGTLHFMTKQTDPRQGASLLHTQQMLTIGILRKLTEQWNCTVCLMNDKWSKWSSEKGASVGLTQEWGEIYTLLLIGKHYIIRLDLSITKCSPSCASSGVKSSHTKQKCRMCFCVRQTTGHLGRQGTTLLMGKKLVFMSQDPVIESGVFS